MMLPIPPHTHPLRAKRSVLVNRHNGPSSQIIRLLIECGPMTRWEICYEIGLDPSRGFPWGDLKKSGRVVRSGGARYYDNDPDNPFFYKVTLMAGDPCACWTCIR